MEWSFFDTQGRKLLAAGQPTGSAGGDLAGTYPSPTVAQASAAFALTGDISPASLSADTNDWNPTGLSGAAVIRVTSSAAINLTGLQGGADGRVIMLMNIGSNNITLKYNSGSSSAANRFLIAGATDVVLTANGFVTLIYDSTTSAWRVFGTTAAATAPSSTITAGPISFYFGTGSDGAFVFDGVNTYPGLASLSGSTYTLLRDIHATSVTVSSGKILVTAQYRIFCTGTFQNSGTVKNDGNVGGNGSTTAGAAGAAIAAGFFAASGAGGIGVVNGAGTDAVQGVQGSVFGAGGIGASAPSATAATVTQPGGRQNGGASPSATGGYQRGFFGGPSLFGSVPSQNTNFAGATGGGGGGSSAAGSGGGGGGGGGGVIFIAANAIINDTSCVISADGGAGGNGGNIAAANTAGGGGGGGGMVLLAYKTLTNSGTIRAAGGAGGTSTYNGTFRTPMRAGITSTTMYTQTLSGAKVNFRTVPNVNSMAGSHIVPPLGNGLVVVAIVANRAAGASAAPTLAGWGATWVNQASVTYNSIATPLNRVTVFTAKIAQGLTYDTFCDGLTATFAATQDNVVWTMDHIYNVDGTTPVVQTATNRSDSTTSLTATLAAFGDAKNGTWCVAAGNTLAPTPSANFTALSGSALATTPRMTSAGTQGNQTACNFTCTASVLAIIGMEIKAASSADSGYYGLDGYVAEYLLT